MTSIVKRLSKKIELLSSVENRSLGAHERICSDNAKTGFSINFPLGPKGTCRPSPVCSETCYGAMPGKPITWEKSILKYWRVYRYFMEAKPDEIAERIHGEYVRRGMTFLRWNGVGDLFPESAAVISSLTRKHPEDILLVVTRKPEMVPLIPNDAENLYLMFSLDGSEDSKRRKASVSKYKHKRLYFSFLRRFAQEDTLRSRIIFNAQQSKKILPYDDPITVCPVDADKILVKGACAKCRKCFRPDVLDGSYHKCKR